MIILCSRRLWSQRYAHRALLAAGRLGGTGLPAEVTVELPSAGDAQSKEPGSRCGRPRPGWPRSSPAGWAGGLIAGLAGRGQFLG
jgi:hypothetical protein